MKRLLPIGMLLLLALPVAADEKPAAKALPGGTCYSCHLEMEDESAQMWADDVHAKAGIGCEKCHGGDPTASDMDLAKAKKTGFKGRPSHKEIPKLCGGCHSNPTFMKEYNPLLPIDQVAKYQTSVHGKKLQQGDQKVAECASCHGAHGIRKVNDAKSPVYASNLPAMCAKCHADAKYMQPYKIPTDQYEKYKQSVHGKALLEKGDVRGAPACNDCHGNHGARPPDAASITNVCGACHSHNAELFLSSKMAKGFAKKGLAECVECHSNHLIVHTSDDWVGDQPKSLCIKCHKVGDKGAMQAALLADSIGATKQKFAAVTAVIEDARLKGMDTGEADDKLQEARQSLIQARTEIHAFAKGPVEKKLEESNKTLETALVLGNLALREYVTRRLGLGISSFFLTLLVIALWIKIRSLPPR